LPKIHIYQTQEKECPFENWLDTLSDINAKARILQRIDRIELGNFGDCEPVGDGVHELRIDHGSGYRIYFGNDGKYLVILLCGGTKRGQEKDIKRAKAYWQDYKARKK
jgi:putative addiction module killer protein